MSAQYRWFIATAAALLLVGCGTEPPPESVFAVADFRADKHKRERPRCRQYSATRHAWFGDLHVHTGISNDAWAFDVQVDPPGSHYGLVLQEVKLLGVSEKNSK